MAVNDIYTLPLKVRSMQEMADLLNAEQQEIALIGETIKKIEKELHIYSSTSLLGRYEKQFGLSTNPMEDLEERRRRIIAKLNARQMTTVESIQELVQIITGGTAEIIERYQKYLIAIIIYLPVDDKNVFYKTLVKQIDEVKPAHLGLSITYNIALSTGVYFGTAISEYKEEVIC